jgi:hypothetical protein
MVGLSVTSAVSCLDPPQEILVSWMYRGRSDSLSRRGRRVLANIKKTRSHSDNRGNISSKILRALSDIDKTGS